MKVEKTCPIDLQLPISKENNSKGSNIIISNLENISNTLKKEGASNHPQKIGKSCVKKERSQSEEFKKEKNERRLKIISELEKKIDEFFHHLNPDENLPRQKIKPACDPSIFISEKKEKREKRLESQDEVSIEDPKESFNNLIEDLQLQVLFSNVKYHEFNTKTKENAYEFCAFFLENQKIKKASALLNTFLEYKVLAFDDIVKLTSKLVEALSKEGVGNKKLVDTEAWICVLISEEMKISELENSQELQNVMEKYLVMYAQKDPEGLLKFLSELKQSPLFQNKTEVPSFLSFEFIASLAIQVAIPTWISECEQIFGNLGRFLNYFVLLISKISDLKSEGMEISELENSQELEKKIQDIMKNYFSIYAKKDPEGLLKFLSELKQSPLFQNKIEILPFLSFEFIASLAVNTAIPTWISECKQTSQNSEKFLNCCARLLSKISDWKIEADVTNLWRSFLEQKNSVKVNLKSSEKTLFVKFLNVFKNSEYSSNKSLWNEFFIWLPTVENLTSELLQGKWNQLEQIVSTALCEIDEQDLENLDTFVQHISHIKKISVKEKGKWNQLSEKFPNKWRELFSEKLEEVKTSQDLLGLTYLFFNRFEELKNFETKGLVLNHAALRVTEWLDRKTLREDMKVAIRQIIASADCSDKELRKFTKNLFSGRLTPNMWTNLSIIMGGSPFQQQEILDTKIPINSLKIARNCFELLEKQGVDKCDNFPLTIAKQTKVNNFFSSFLLENSKIGPALNKKEEDLEAFCNFFTRSTTFACALQGRYAVFEYNHAIANTKKTLLPVDDLHAVVVFLASLGRLFNASFTNGELVPLLKPLEWIVGCYSVLISLHHNYPHTKNSLVVCQEFWDGSVKMLQTAEHLMEKFHEKIELKEELIKIMIPVRDLSLLLINNEIPKEIDLGPSQEILLNLMYKFEEFYPTAFSNYSCSISTYLYTCLMLAVTPSKNFVIGKEKVLDMFKTLCIQEKFKYLESEDFNKLLEQSKKFFDSDPEKLEEVKKLLSLRVKY